MIQGQGEAQVSTLVVALEMPIEKLGDVKNLQFLYKLT